MGLISQVIPRATPEAVRLPESSNLRMPRLSPSFEMAGPSFATPRWSFGNLAVRPKLRIGAVDDPLEHEADRVADKVMRMADSALPAIEGAPTTLRRKCSACQDETALHRMPVAAAVPQSPAEAPESVHRVLAGPGVPLDRGLRAFFEPRFGHDFGDVRVHSGATAAASAREIDALAYTVGSDIVLDSGRYQPNVQGRLLAHELAHVVQNGTNANSLRRFASEEHVRIGDTVEPGTSVDIPNVGVATYGEMIALGDYFATVSEILQAAQDPMFGADQVKVALWKVNPSVRKRPLVGQNVEDRVMSRYYDLASKNQTHFSTGSEPGKSNREQFISMHQAAISNAYSQGSNGVVQGISWQGREGFAEHFLTDAFSAGHVRTPRQEIRTFWNGKYPNFAANLVNMICCYMASYINDRDNIGIIATVDMLADGIKPILLQKAGDVLNAFAFGDLVSKILHDADNAGLEVQSQSGAGTGSGPLTWRDLGDGYLYLLPKDASKQMQDAQKQTQAMVNEAVRRSFAEGQAAFEAGQRRAGNLDAMTNPANFKALELIPTVNLGAANPVYDWQAQDIPSLNPTMQNLVTRALLPGQEIGDQLNDMKVPCVSPKSVAGVNFDLHTWEAWVCFRNMLLAAPIRTLDRIARGDTCPPEKNNPCGRITTPCP